METLNAFIQLEIINMSWHPCSWSVVVEDLPIDHLGKRAWGQGGTPGSSVCIHSFPLEGRHSTMAYHNILISWLPRQGPVRMWWDLTSLIAGLLCETAYAWGRGADTGKEENEICEQVSSYSVCNWEARSDSQTQKYPGSHNEDEGSGVHHMAKFPASLMGCGLPLGALHISAIASSSWPHHKVILPA